MTDRTNEIDQAERIRRLQERRAASSGSRRPANPRTASSATAPMTAPAARPTSSRAPAAGRKRRRHPAAASRWLLAGLSVASFFTIAGTVAVANVNSAATPPASTPTAVVATTALPATQAVTPATAAPTAPTPAAQKATTAPAPHTTTRGS